MTEQENIRELARILNVTTDEIRRRLDDGAISGLGNWTHDDLYRYARACEWADPGVKHTAIIGKQGVQE